MGNNDLRDEITREWFCTETVVLEVEPALEGWLPNDSLIRLSGAPRNSKVKVSYLQDEAIELRVSNSSVLAEDMVRLIFQNEGSYSFYVQNSVFVLNQALRKSGIGARSFCIEVTEATELELFDHIETNAIGNYATMTAVNPDEQYNGPYSWARMGFDAEIPPYVLAYCDEELSDLTRVHQLMALPRGREIWALHADSMWLQFNLKPDSECWKTLNSYMQEKGIRVIP